MFIWLDLRQWLAGSSWEAEDQLWQRLTYEHLLLLTPGGAGEGLRAAVHQ
jgi:hypothetical protein